MLDPTRPEVLAVVDADIRRLVDEWGYELVKHDFSTHDLLGDWGPKLAESVTPDGWVFASRTHTTAEVINPLYAKVRQAAGDPLDWFGSPTPTTWKFGSETRTYDWS